MKVPKLDLSFLIFLFLSVLAIENSHAITNSAYLNGKEELDAGNPDRAVAIWLQGWNELDSAGLVDPRIGFALIETVTEQEMSHLYEQAAHIYLWGFQITEIDPWKEDFQAELDRLQPIVHPDQFAHWQQLLDENDPALLNRLRSFWITMDPMPATEYNPRIVEHWERIAYARQNFTVNDRTPYGTDERGLIYVKYGPPDEIQFDTFRMDRGKLISLARLTVPDRGDLASFAQEARARAHAVENIAGQIFRESRYEVWKYHLTNDELVFFYGRPEGNGPFQLLDSILDLLPARYNRTSTSNQYGDLPSVTVNIAPMAITSALEQGATYDPSYLTDLTEMYILFDMINTTASRFTWNPNLYQEIHFRVEDNAIHKRFQADDQLSWLDRNIPPLSIDSHTWRFLDQQNNPYTVTSLFSTFPETDLILNPELQRIYLRSSIVAGSEHSEVSCRDTEVQRIYPEDLLDEDQQNRTITSLITCPQTGQESYSLLTAELFDLGSDASSSDITAPSFLSTISGLLALGRSEAEILEPLPSDTNLFTASDLVLGLSSGGSGFDFSDLRLIPSNRFPIGEDIVLFYEVYNLGESSGPFREYTLHYEIHPVRTRMQRLFGTGEEDREQSITLHFETQESRASQQIELELAGVTDGEYELVITFTDIQSGQTIQRMERFILEESP